MTPDQRELLDKAARSIRGATVLAADGLHNFAVSRAYYAMFYLAEAVLLGEGLAFGKHSAVASAFGREFARTGRVRPELHAYLLQAQKLRTAADYGADTLEDADASAEQIRRAEEFLAEVTALLGGGGAGSAA